jgi:two-component system C4-dicarboxylate transport sensor histidine kinase DctB
MMLLRRPLLMVILIALLVAALGVVAMRGVQLRAEHAADRTAASAAASQAGLLTSELQKFRLLPLVLADYPDAIAALSGRDEGRRLDRTLELLASRTDAAVIYAIGSNGQTIAASNWRLPTSFVGQNYAFRPYFVDAMRRGAAELFALGTVSGRPGLYLARRIDRDGRALGVIVVKVEFDEIEANWARAPGIGLATDAQGVILVTSVPDWRFRPTHSLDPATIAAARRARQFGTGPLRRPPLTIDGPDASITATGVRYRVARVASPLAGGSVLHLAPLAPALAAARSQALLWTSGLLIVAVVLGGIALRVGERRRMQDAARVALEREVASRTADLREANARLQIESMERSASDSRYRAAREELAQANRLGSIGQITAGVAHEINQPVATIRTFAENATTFLDRNSVSQARQNLGQIVSLTDRIGAITAELRAFARRRRGAAAPVAVGAILDGLQLLLGERTRGVLSIVATSDVRAIDVVGDRIRLEQILVNLVQNALDAVHQVAVPMILLTVTASPSSVNLTVEDNGAGIDPAVADTLFTPFASAKPEGLGLGLAIARDIAREFGGELVAQDRATGACFALTLVRAA